MSDYIPPYHNVLDLNDVYYDGEILPFDYFNSLTAPIQQAHSFAQFCSINEFDAELLNNHIDDAKYRESDNIQDLFSDEKF